MQRKKRVWNCFNDIGVHRKILSKVKNPWSFIRGFISGIYYGKALCDLRGSTNLSLKSIFKNLGISGVKPTTANLKLADMSLLHPHSKIYDVLVMENKLVFPSHFIILDFEVDNGMFIILGRHFLDRESRDWCVQTWTNHESSKVWIFLKW